MKKFLVITVMIMALVGFAGCKSREEKMAEKILEESKEMQNEIMDDAKEMQKDIMKDAKDMMNNN